MENSAEYITITKSEYEHLKSAQLLLDLLEEAGVDEWYYYGAVYAEWCRLEEEE